MSVNVNKCGIKYLTTSTDTLNNKLELLETLIFHEKNVAVQENHYKNDNEVQ